MQTERFTPEQGGNQPRFTAITEISDARPDSPIAVLERPRTLPQSNSDLLARLEMDFTDEHRDLIVARLHEPLEGEGGIPAELGVLGFENTLQATIACLTQGKLKPDEVAPPKVLSDLEDPLDIDHKPTQAQERVLNAMIEEGGAHSSNAAIAEKLDITEGQVERQLKRAGERLATVNREQLGAVWFVEQREKVLAEKPDVPAAKLKQFFDVIPAPGEVPVEDIKLPDRDLKEEIPELKITSEQAKITLLMTRGYTIDQAGQILGIPSKRVQNKLREMYGMIEGDERGSIETTERDAGLVLGTPNQDMVDQINAGALTKGMCGILSASLDPNAPYKRKDQVADDFGISVKTVRNHLQDARARLGATSTSSVITAYAYSDNVSEETRQAMLKIARKTFFAPEPVLIQEPVEKSERHPFFARYDLLTMRAAGRVAVTPSDLGLTKTDYRRTELAVYKESGAVNPLNLALISIERDVVNWEEVIDYDMQDRFREALVDGEFSEDEIKVLDEMIADHGAHSESGQIAGLLGGDKTEHSVRAHKQSVYEKINAQADNKQTEVGVNWYLFKNFDVLRRSVALSLSDQYLAQHPDLLDRRAVTDVPDDRQLEILTLKARGLGNAQVGQIMERDEATIRNNISLLNGQYGFSCATEAVVKCLDANILREGRVADEALITAFDSPPQGVLTKPEEELLDCLITEGGYTSVGVAQKLGLENPAHGDGTVEHRFKRIKEKLLRVGEPLPSREKVAANWFIHRRRQGLVGVAA